MVDQVVKGRSPAEAGSGLRPFGVEPAAPSQAEPLVPNADRLRAILSRWRRREERDDGPCWHSVPEIGRALFSKGKLSQAEKDATCGLLVKLVTHGDAEPFEFTGQGTYYRADGAEFAPKPVRVPGPKVFVLQREMRGKSVTASWFDAEAFETSEEALARLEYRRWEAQACINGRGGSGYTGEHPQQMRVVHLVSDPAQAIEARSAATGTGAVEDESAVPQGCAHPGAGQ